MKKFIVSLVGALLSFSLIASAGPGGDSFPWGSELPFPWKGIQGNWIINIEGVDAYVIFKVLRSESLGSRQLRISIIDRETCRVIAVGAGYEDGRIIKAILTSGSRASQVTVHVFRESDLKNQSRQSYKAYSQVTIMSVVSLTGSQEKMAYELTKVGNDLRPTCL